MYRCQGCDKGFSRKDNMKKHRAENCRDTKKMAKSIVQNAENDHSESLGDEVMLSNQRKRKPELSETVTLQKNTGKVKKVITESPSNSDNEELGQSEWPEDKKEQNKILMDAFQKLYNNFDEDDLEMQADTMNLLNALKERKCMSEAEYEDIKSQLKGKSEMNMYETIDSTIERMTEDDKNEILGLLNSMSKDKVAFELIPIVNKYFEKEMELDNVLRLLSKLKDKLNKTKLTIILKNIERTRNRVKKIFTQLMNGSEKEENLKNLRSSNHITDEQYEKLLIAPHNLTSISRIVEGRGMFLSRKKWYQ